MSIVEKDSTGAVTDERLFIWAGLSILQERDGNNTITKNYFANGFENLSSGTQYYYTRDHLGSIREVTDSTGTLVASYDYSPYGTRTLTSGSDISDFGYTGHFTHAKSGLVLAPYRAYDPQLGRWLSRDPIQEGDGPNLYAYVHNDPINGVDPTGELLAPAIEIPVATIVAVVVAGVVIANKESIIRTAAQIDSDIRSTVGSLICPTSVGEVSNEVAMAGGKGNVADTGIMEEASAALGNRYKKEDLCKWLRAAKEAALKAKDHARAARIKTTIKYHCRGYRG